MPRRLWPRTIHCATVHIQHGYSMQAMQSLLPGQHISICQLHKHERHRVLALPRQLSAGILHLVFVYSAARYALHSLLCWLSARAVSGLWMHYCSRRRVRCLCTGRLLARGLSYNLHTVSSRNRFTTAQCFAVHRLQRHIEPSPARRTCLFDAKQDCLRRYLPTWSIPCVGQCLQPLSRWYL